MQPCYCLSKEFVKADERSGASQEALTMGAKAVGCGRTGGKWKLK